MDKQIDAEELKNKVPTTDLHINGLDFTNTDRLKAFCRGLSELKSLTDLTLSNVMWNEESLSHFGEWLVNSNITALTFNHMMISDEAHELFSQSLQKNKNLKSISFNNIGLSNQTLQSYGKRILDIPTLDSFSLHSDHVDHVGFETLFENLKRTQRLTSLSLGSINFDKNFIDKLVSVFPMLPLKALVLLNDNIHSTVSEGFTALFHWLATNTTLESLHLTDMFFSGIAICESIKASLTQNKHLRKFFIRQHVPLRYRLGSRSDETSNPVETTLFKVICELFKTNNTITDLTFDQTGELNQEDYQAVKEMIHQNKTLKKLEVGQSIFQPLLYSEDFCHHLKNNNFSLHTFKTMEIQKVGKEAREDIQSQIHSFGKRNQKLDIYKLSKAISKFTPLFAPLASIVISYYLETDYDPEYNINSEDKEKLVQFAYKKHQQQEDTLELDSAQNKELIEWIETQSQSQTNTLSEPERGQKNGTQ